MQSIYRDRREAGRVLADAMSMYSERDDLLILGLPRGGVPVAFEIAAALEVPLDLLIVRKLGVPGHEELAMGAIASGGVRVVNEDVIASAKVTPDAIEAVEAREREELGRREREYRGDRPQPQVGGRCVVLVDDGLATGASMFAAVAAARQLQPAQIVVAVPVAPEPTIRSLTQRVDEVICPSQPDPFYGVGTWYDDFSQTSDDEVRALLARAWDSEHQHNARRFTGG